MTEQDSRPVAGEPRIEKMGAMRLAGVYYAGKNENGEIGALWDQQFIPRIGEMRPAGGAGMVAYGACRMPEDPAALEPGAFEYLAAVRVDSLEGLPEGMTGWEVPAQTYAVLPAHGIPEIPRAFEYLYGTWAKQSPEWEAADGICFEYYPETFPEDDRVDVCIPVKPRTGSL